MGGFRKTLISWGGKVLLVLLIISFGMWGITDYINPTAANLSIASVGGVEISTSDLRLEVRRQIDNFRRGSGVDLDPDQARSMGIIENSVESLVQRQLIVLSADQMGLLIDDKSVRAEVHADKNFQGPLGRFDRDRFNQVLRQVGLDEIRYLDFLRFEMLSRQFLSNLEAARGAPKSLVDAVYRYRAEKRVAQILRFDHDRIKVQKEPTETALREFHQKNADRFTAPEYRGLTLVRLKPEALVDRIKIAEDTIKEAYDDRLDEFTTPERRTLQQILLDDQAKAKKAAARLASGEDFLKVAREAANMQAAEVKIGTFEHAGMLLPELADTVFALSLNAPSGPLESDLGWHILRVTKIIPPTRTSFAAARAKLRQEMAREKAIDLVFELSNKLEDALGGGASLDEAARGLNLPVTRIAAVSPTGLDKADKKVLEPAEDGVLIKTIFETPKGIESALTEANETDIFILRVDNITPPALRPFASVRAGVLEGWKREQKAATARSLAKKALNLVRSGRKWEDIANELKAQTLFSKPFQRNGAGLEKPLPASIIADLFKVRTGETVEGRDAAAQFLARVTKIVPAEPANEQKSVEQLRRQLGQSMSNDLANQLVAALRRRHGVTLNRAAIAQVF